MQTIILATTNPDKIKEYQALLGNLPLKLVLPPTVISVAETGKTFSLNARLKAEAYGQKFKLPVLADDTGLCIKAMHNQPGILSHHFARRGFPAARKKILKALNGLPLLKRQACFVCALAYYDPKSRKTTVFTGRANGFIALQETGSHGFGYDPIFFSTQLKTTFAQCSLKQKNQVSHRGIAFKKFIAASKASKHKEINPVLIKS
ncbi:MAG: RdgB/HAM1 family non-canonical purine NTP pyrophosphatase [Candidatus Beckwithbacteria bacterium]